MVAASPSRAVAQPEPLTPTGDVLSAIADELERVRTLGLRIEGAICAIAVRSSIDASLVGELQQLDAILQHVAALRDFTSELSRNVDSKNALVLGPALDRVTLGDVRARLGCGYVEENPDEVWEML